MTNAATNNASAFDPFDAKAIATKICNALINIQADHPEWIQEKIRHIQLSENKAKIIPRLSSILENTSVGQTQITSVVRFVEKFLDPAWLETQDYQKLAQLITSAISAKAIPLQQNQNLQTVWLHENSETKSNFPTISSQNLAILLLDAENIDLAKDAEDWLATFCKYPLSLKFAFGNWKQLGDRDKHLHQRGYHLIHVPVGKNHADSKMTIIGSSVFVHLPSIKEAIVCSNDSDLETLRNTLRFQGLDVRLLQRHQQTLMLTHCQTRETLIFELPAPKSMPSIKVGNQFCREYLKNSSGKALLSQISSDFSRRFGFSVGAFAKHHKLGKSAKTFFQASSEFKVVANQQSAQVVIELVIPKHHEISSTQTVGSEDSRQFTTKGLQIVSLGIIKRLIKESPSKPIPIGNVAATFRQQYGRPFKAVLKDLGLSQSVPSFLQTCQPAKVEQVGITWVVTLAQ